MRRTNYRTSKYTLLEGEYEIIDSIIDKSRSVLREEDARVNIPLTREETHIIDVRDSFDSLEAFGEYCLRPMGNDILADQMIDWIPVHILSWGVNEALGTFYMHYDSNDLDGPSYFGVKFEEYFRCSWGDSLNIYLYEDRRDGYCEDSLEIDDDESVGLIEDVLLQECSNITLEVLAYLARLPRASKMGIDEIYFDLDMECDVSIRAAHRGLWPLKVSWSPHTPPISDVIFDIVDAYKKAARRNRRDTAL